MSIAPQAYWSDQGIEYLRSRTRMLKNWAKSAKDTHVHNVAAALEGYDPRAFWGRPADNLRRAELLIGFLNGIRGVSYAPNLLGPVNQLLGYFNRVKERPNVPVAAHGTTKAPTPPPSPFDYVPPPRMPPPWDVPDWWTDRGRIYVRDQMESMENFYECYAGYLPERWARKVCPRLKQIQDALVQFRQATTDDSTAENRQVLAGRILVLLKGDWLNHMPDEDPARDRMLEDLEVFFRRVEQHPARPQAQRAPVPGWLGWQGDTWVYSQTTEIEKALRKSYPASEQSVANRLQNAIDLIRNEYLYRERNRASANEELREHTAERALEALTKARSELAHSRHFQYLRPVVLDLIEFFQYLRENPMHPCTVRPLR